MGAGEPVELLVGATVTFGPERQRFGAIAKADEGNAVLVIAEPLYFQIPPTEGLVLSLKEPAQPTVLSGKSTQRYCMPVLP